MWKSQSKLLSIATTVDHASDELRRDKEAVMASVANSGLTVNDTSDILRGDKEVVGAAVDTHGGALQHVSTRRNYSHSSCVAKLLHCIAKTKQQGSSSAMTLAGLLFQKVMGVVNGRNSTEGEAAPADVFADQWLARLNKTQSCFYVLCLVPFNVH